MRNVLILVTLAACTEAVTKTETIPGETLTNTLTETVVHTNTETNTVTQTVPAPVDPVLTVSYTTALSGQGNWTFERGASQVNFGAFTFDPTVLMRIRGFQPQTYVNTNPSDLFSYYSESEQDGKAFADHFRDCALRDFVSGTTLAGPENPDPVTGKILFTSSILLDPANPTPIAELFCDHTGEWPIEEYNGFAVDFALSSDIVVDAGGQLVEVAFGNQNGGAYPSMARILQDSACTFDVIARSGVEQMHNEVTGIISGWSPNGPLIMGENGVLTPILFAQHPCTDVYASEFDILVDASDDGGTGWNTAIPMEIVNLNTGLEIWAGVVTAGVPTPVNFGLSILADSTATLEFQMFTEGATDGDRVQVHMLENTLNWSDGLIAVEDAEFPSIDGGPIVLQEDGDMVLSANGPLPGGLIPGVNNQPIHTTFMTSLFENALVDEMEYQIDGDVSIVAAAKLTYRDVAGNVVTQTTVPSPSGEVEFSGMNLLATASAQEVMLKIDVIPSASDGQAVQATLITSQIHATGTTSGREYDLGSDITPSAEIVGYEQTVL